MELRKTEPDYYQDFLSPDQRAELLELVQPELEALQETTTYPPSRPSIWRARRRAGAPIRAWARAQARDRIALRPDQQAYRVSARSASAEICRLPSEERSQRRRPARRFEDESERSRRFDGRHAAHAESETGSGRMTKSDAHRPLITIGITCYNAEDTIQRAVDCALAQTWTRARDRHRRRRLDGSLPPQCSRSSSGRMTRFALSVTGRTAGLPRRETRC